MRNKARRKNDMKDISCSVTEMNRGSPSLGIEIAPYGVQCQRALVKSA